MSTEPFSLESTVSVESPRTPDPSSDPIKLCLPMSDESDAIKRLIEDHNREKEKMIEDHKEEIRQMIETHKRETEKSIEDHHKKIDKLIEDHQKQIDKLEAKVQKIEAESGVLKTDVKAFGKALMVDKFDELIKSLSPKRIKARMEKIIESCMGKEKHEVSETLFKTTEDPHVVLRKLGYYLNMKGDDPEIHSRLISLFRRVGSFALKSPQGNPTNENPGGVDNEYIRDHEFRMNQEHSTRIFSSHSLVDQFFNEKNLEVTDIFPLLGIDYHNGDKDGEEKSVSIVHYFFKACRDLLNKFGKGKGIKFLREPKLHDIPGNEEDKNQQRPDGAAVEGERTVILNEVKSSLGIDQKKAKTMKSLPRGLEGSFAQSCGYMFAFLCSLLILTDGFVYIKLRIQVEKFFANKQYYTRSKIVPYEFEMFHINDPNFMDSLVDCLLEAKETNEVEELKEMERYYRKPNNQQAKRRRIL